jgi:hypothetical protein
VLRSLVACALSLAGCFGPDPREGLRCSAAGDCPPGQDCYLVQDSSVCLSEAPFDGSPPDDRLILFGVPVEVELLCGAEVACASPRDPSLTADLRQIAFTAGSMNADMAPDVYLATREKPEDMWQTAVPAGGIDTALVEEGGWLSGDGLALFFSRADQSAGGPPYSDLWQSDRLDDMATFDTALPLPGVVNTSHGSERWAVRTADKTQLLFARALDAAPGDNDLYLARDMGGQWDTAVRVAGVSLPGDDERSLALVEEQKTLFVSRGGRIFEARWKGDDIAGAEVLGPHDELQVAGATVVSGVWAAPDASEIWFGACGESCGVYRAIR